MGKHVGLSLVVIGLIFFMAWVWGGPASPQEDSTPPAEREDTGESTGESMLR